MIAVVNYANELYEKAQKYCTKTAYKHGADKVFEYGPNDIDENFYNKNKHILSQKRGNGYWLWKPYIICKTLDKLKDNDYLFYVDSGSYFIRDINLVIDCMRQNGDDIISFPLPYIERQWTKKEIINYFHCENDDILDSNQRMATFIVMKKTKRTVEFFKRYLDIAQMNNMITDELNPNIQDPFFIDNRHDQSIFSILSKLENVPAYLDPTEYGKYKSLLSIRHKEAIFQIPDFDSGNYKQIIVLHKKGEVTSFVKIFGWIRSNLPEKLILHLLNLYNHLFA